MALDALNIQVADMPHRRFDYDGWRKAKRPRIVSDEEEYLAGCLVMLANGGGLTSSSSSIAVDAAESSNPMAQDNFYKCGVCDKAFSSYQALGGHKASHRNKSAAESEDKKIGAPASPNLKVGVRLHQCSICQKIFPTGQALGGHKRKHYEGIIGRNGGAKNGVNSSGVSSDVTSSDGGDGDHSHGDMYPVRRDLDLNFPPLPELDLSLVSAS